MSKFEKFIKAMARRYAKRQKLYAEVEEIKYGKNGEEFKNNWAIKNGFVKSENTFSNHR